VPLGADCAAAIAGTPITRAKAVEEKTNFVMALIFLLRCRRTPAGLADFFVAAGPFGRAADLS
jgi:hypothetical protein